MVSVKLVISFLLVGIVFFGLYHFFFQKDLPTVYVSGASWVRRSSVLKKWNGTIINYYKLNGSFINESDVLQLAGKEYVAFQNCFIRQEEGEFCGIIPNQSVNFHPDGNFFGRKFLFKELLYEQPEDEFNAERFYPKTFAIHDKSERESFISYLEKTYGYDSVPIYDEEDYECCKDCFYSEMDLLTCSTELDIWLMKPGSSFQGRGMKLVDPRKPVQFINDLRRTYSSVKMVKKNFLVQRYLPNPFLYDNRKPSQRVHFMVLSVEPLLVLGYNNFRVIVARDNYTLDNLDDVSIHATNGFQQRRKNKIEDEEKEILILGMNTYSQSMEDDHPSVTSSLEFQETFLEDAFSIVSYIVKMYRNRLMNNDSINHFYNNTDENSRGKYPHFFALFCMDLMLDSELKIWLHEVNWKCLLRANSGVTKRHNLPLVKEMWLIVDEFRRKRNNFVDVDDLMDLKSLNKWRWVIRGEEDFFPDLYK